MDTHDCRLRRGQGLQGGSGGTQGRKRPWGATLAWPRRRGLSPRGWDRQGSCHDTRALMGRTQTWEEAGRVGGPPGPEEQHLHLCLQWGREGHSGPHLQAWPHTLTPAEGRRACRHPHSSGLEWGLWAPEAPGVPALLSRKGPARVRQPGGHHLDSPGLPCDPTSLRPGDPNIRQLHKEKPAAGPASGH